MNYTLFEYGKPIAAFEYEEDAQKFIKIIRERNQGLFVTDLNKMYKLEVKGHKTFYTFGSILTCSLPEPVVT